MSTEKKAPSVSKRVKKNEDEDFEIDSDFLDDEDLEDLINDSDSNKPIKSLIKKEPKAEDFPQARQKQATFWATSKKLDKFGYSNSTKKLAADSRYQNSALKSAAKPLKGSDAQIPNPVKMLKAKANKPAKDGEEELCMKDMSEKQILEGLPEFLHKDKKRDLNMRLMTDPNYDPTTLHVPN